MTPYLHTGRNCVAVQAYHYGCQNAYTRDARAGLFAELVITDADGARQVIGTDGQWRVRAAQGWRRDVYPMNIYVGMPEVYDANLDPPDWHTTDFDDSRWEPAFVIPAQQCPWTYLEPRQTPRLDEKIIYPERIVQVGEMTLRGGSFLLPHETQVAERLAMSVAYPLEYATIENPEAILHGDGQTARLQGSAHASGDPAKKGDRSPYILVDFGRPVFGFPRVQLEGGAGSVVEMTYGPQLLDGRIVPIMQGVRYGDRYTLRPGPQTWQVFEYRQFRYLQIVCHSIETPLSIQSVSVVAYTYPAVQRGRFACADAALTRLWQACVDTTYLHMEDAILCDAVRERRCWVGDGAHGLFGIWAAYGDIALNDAWARLLARGQMEDGLLRMFYPGTEPSTSAELSHWDPRTGEPATTSESPLNIPQFSLLYVIHLDEYDRYYGKQALVAELYPALVRLAGWFTRHTDDTGLLYNLPYWNFLDWVATDMAGANFATNALYYQMLQCLQRMATALGQADDAARWLASAENVKAALQRQHWDGARGLFVDSVSAGRQSTAVTETANGLALLYGIATAEQAAQIVPCLADPQTDIARASPLFFSYTVEGLIRAGAVETALAQVRRRYAPMLAASDAPTIWEHWQLGAQLAESQVHSGGVGPAWTLSKHVLGVYPVGVGFRRCRIEPQTGTLQWARGVFPTVRGDIEVVWSKEEDRFVLDVVLPVGLETDLALVRPEGQAVRLIHNDQSVYIGASKLSIPGVQLSARRVVLTVSGGSHHVELRGM